jgi:hypothetical protein
MKSPNLLVASGAAFLFVLIFSGNVYAQWTCQLCDDTDWTQTTCRIAEWYEEGEDVWANERCTLPEGKVGECPPIEPTCWGEIPDDPLAFNIRPDGTLVTPGISETPVLSPARFARDNETAEGFGLSEQARIQERNCKGLLTGRVYGALTTRMLRTRSERIAI